MINSSLQGLHKEGVTVCSALQELHLCGNCSIHGENDNQMYHASEDTTTAVPFDMPCLTSFCDAVVDLASMCALPALHSLELAVSGGCTIPPEDPAIVGLSQLSNLSIAEEGDDELGVEMFIDWRAFQALQQLQLIGDLVVDTAIWGSAEVKSLKSVNFCLAHYTNNRHPDLPTIDFADLHDQIAAQRPDICVGSMLQLKVTHHSNVPALYASCCVGVSCSRVGI